MKYKKYLFIVIIFLFGILTLVSCSDNLVDDNNSNENNQIEYPVTDEKEELIKFFRAESIADFEHLKEIITWKMIDEELIKEINNVYDEYVLEINKETSVSKITALNDTYTKKMYDKIPVQTNNINIKDVLPDEILEADIRYLLDQYLFRNNLIGIPLSSTDNLNLNSTNQTTWEKFFGEDGTIVKTKKEEYWDLNPLLSNKNFIKGLNLCIDKSLLQEFKSINSLSIRKYAPDYTKFRYYYYNLEKARKYFRLALEEMIETGVYTISNKPIKLTIEICYTDWTKSNNLEEIHNIIKKCIEDAFNTEVVTNGNFTLEITSWLGKTFTSVFNEKLNCGKFDIGFGYISRSYLKDTVYRKYHLYSSTKENCEDGLAVNWSIDTNSLEEDCIVYKGYRYSYDALLLALDGQVLIENGVVKSSWLN